jgi:hypothetical protein
VNGAEFGLAAPTSPADIQKSMTALSSSSFEKSALPVSDKKVNICAHNVTISNRTLEVNTVGYSPEFIPSTLELLFMNQSDGAVELTVFETP